MGSASAKPLVSVRSLGGTVAMTSGDGHGATPTLDAAALLAAIPGLDSVATLDVESWSSIPSASLRIEELIQYVDGLAKACESGAVGVVLTTGTDSMEEVAYLLDLLWQRPEPVVVTGAMRAADAPGADGPANLLAAVVVASSPAARDQGCLVVMNDEVHEASAVRKLHTTSPSAFGSPTSGPAGRVHEGRLLLTRPCLSRATFRLPPPGTRVPRVALLRVSLGDDATLLRKAVEVYDGVVVEALGGGHVPTWWAQLLIDSARQKPIVLASRTGAGPLLRCTYGFSGSERHLLDGGLVSAGSLDGLKARILLTVVLMLDPESVATHFPGPPGTVEP